MFTDGGFIALAGWKPAGDEVRESRGDLIACQDPNDQYENSPPIVSQTMTNRVPARRQDLLLLVLVFLSTRLFAAGLPPKPNIIFILVDDLGSGDVGVFFQNARREKNERSEPWHLTPQLDRLAAEGVRMPHHYCPAPVCAPSRASLLLGVHQGHANVRDNQFDKALENNHTLATVLKGAGYATAAIGKWGLQGQGNSPATWPAYPTKRGFDFYFGYVRHRDGHAHYPKEDGKELWENGAEISADLAGCYTADLFTARAKKWIADQQAARRDQPFFLYLAYDTPHAKLQLPAAAYPAGGGVKGGLQWMGKSGRMINTASGVPDSYVHPDYAGATWDHDRDAATPEEPWPDVYRRYATNVRRIDEAVGDLLAQLDDLGIGRDTLLIFTTDNGPSRESYLPGAPYEPTFFNSFGPFDGIKRDLWEGGIRVGALARWPARIAPDRISDSPSMFHDWMPTFAEVAGVPAPARSDGVSLVPALTGAGTQKASTVYVEYFEGAKTPGYEEFENARRGRVRKQMQAIRMGDFMGVRYGIQRHAEPFEIYNVVTDPKQTRNVAAEQPELQQRMHDATLRVRHPDAQAKRPYDHELVPALPSAEMQPGVEWRVFNQPVPWLAKLDDLASSRTHTGAWSKAIGAGPAAGAMLITGCIEAPADGEYTFWLPADVPGLLRIHDATVVDAAFAASPQETSGTIRLQAGKHPFRLYVGRGAASLDWSVPEMARQPVPGHVLFRKQKR